MGARSLLPGVSQINPGLAAELYRTTLTYNHPYLYVRANPTSSSDPKGLRTLVGAAAGAPCITLVGISQLEDLSLITEAMRQANETLVRIRELEKCPGKEEEVERLRHQHAALIAQTGAKGAKTAGVLAVGIAVCFGVAFAL